MGSLQGLPRDAVDGDAPFASPFAPAPAHRDGACRLRALSQGLWHARALTPARPAAFCRDRVAAHYLRPPAPDSLRRPGYEYQVNVFSSFKPVVRWLADR